LVHKDLKVLLVCRAYKVFKARKETLEILVSVEVRGYKEVLV
jgi:hypothetical protein